MTGNMETIAMQEIHLKPSPMQFCVKELHLMFLCVTALIVWVTMEAGFLRWCILLIFLAVLAFLLCEAVHLGRIKYVLTAEQLIYQHGVFNAKKDFLELYRIIDYRETRTFMQQLAGLKNIIIYSMDRNTPELNIIGVMKNADVIGIIRRRVEYNKQAKGIHEITNRI